jgi:orotate phosphoribosyltransferase
MPSPSRHLLRVHAKEIAGVLEGIYSTGFYERESRSYHRRRKSEVAEWALDLRRPLSQSAFLVPVAAALNGELRGLGIRQAAGRGYGSFALLGGLVATGDNLSAAFVRAERKPYGFREMIEGSVDPDEPIAIVDDLLSTGRSAVRTAAILRDHGLHPTILLTVFCYSWRGGRELLRYHGIACRSLASLSLAGDCA